jgi:hypothetical protein
MSLPTLIVAGAQKSGTTTLHDLLRQHPAIFMSSPKELHFFDKHYDRGLDWYSSCFTPSGAQVHAGESTPFYMYKTVARERMLADLPGVRILCILRDPVARAYSHYWHAREKGPEKSDTFEAALEREPRRRERTPDGQPAAFSYVDRGRYLDQLRPIAETIGRDRLCVLLMEDLMRDPQATMRGVFEFLDLDAGVSSTLTASAANTYGGGESNRQGEARERPLRERGDLPVGHYPPMAQETREHLARHFDPLNRALGDWLGKDLSHWGD